MANNIPMDIILTNILPRLPAKSLVIFKCVCKEWQTYISSPEFISIHLINNQSSSSSNNNNRMLLLTTTQHSFFLTTSLSLPKKLPFSDDTNPSIVGSCNGLVCVHHSDHTLIRVVNPSTGFYKDIPTLRLIRRSSSINYGLGFDRVNDDYKVVRVLDYYTSSRLMFSRDMCRQVSVYSLRENTWRTVEWSVRFDSINDGENGAVVNDNHLVHWFVFSSVLRKFKIRCFDLCLEKWVDDILMPDDYDVSGVVDFGVFDGFLFFSAKNEQEFGNIFDVWIMKEYGVKESWVTLFRISDSSSVMGMAPLAYYGNGRRMILVRRNNCGKKSDDLHKLCWYNVVDKTVERADDIHHQVGDCISANACIGSLVCIPGVDNNLLIIVRTLGLW